MNNRIDAEISPASLAKIQLALDSIKTELPFLIKLANEERTRFAIHSG